MNNFIWRRFGIALLGIGLFGFGLSACSRQDSQNYELEPIEDDASESLVDTQNDEAVESLVDKQIDDISGSDTILVHVCGAVNNPGVYELEAGARVCDALVLAGDFSEDADIDYLNQAEPLCDGQKLYVPTEEESASGDVLSGDTENNATQGSSGTLSDGRIDLNRADLSELKSLPGIGDVKAEAIISYRESHGGFQSVEEIKQVSGIKDSLYENLKSRLYVSK